MLSSGAGQRPLRWRLESQVSGRSNQLRQRPDPHFFHDIGAMKFDGLFRGIQPGGDLLVEHACNNVEHYFTLARGERLIALLQFVESRPVLAAGAVPLQRRVDGMKEFPLAEWFREKIHRPGFHRAHRSRHVAVAADEDDRNPPTGAGQFHLQVEAVQSRHAKIGHQARWQIAPAAVQKLLRRGEGLNLVSRDAQKAFCGAAERRIVVDNEHDRLRLVHGIKGNEQENVAPSSSFACAHNLPP
jgi:hypothetical protein